MIVAARASLAEHWGLAKGRTLVGSKINEYKTLAECVFTLRLQLQYARQGWAYPDHTAEVPLSVQAAPAWCDPQTMVVGMHGTLVHNCCCYPS